MSGTWKAAYTAEEIESVNCPLCQATTSVQLGQEWSLGIVQCTECSLVYVTPRLPEPEKNYWGEKAKALRKYGPIFAGLRPHDRDRGYEDHLARLRALKPTGRLLDIGTHCGFFLRRARHQGWELYGIEPSPTNAALAREHFGLNVQEGYFKEGVFPPEYFDVVTLIDVLEHVTTPVSLLQTIRKVLKPGGILFVKVPNVHWNLLKYRILRHSPWQSRFDIFDCREHVVHYSQATLTHLLEHVGLAVQSFHVPRPIQTGAWWQKVGRAGAWSLARVAFFCTGKLGPLAPDVACIAEKPGKLVGGAAARRLPMQPNGYTVE